MKRIVSVDFLRGLTIAGMIVVNTPGSWEYVYPPLRHAEWHGLTPTDLVFPFFLFIVGISISLAYRGQNTGKPSKAPLKKIAIRSMKIFALGIFLALFPYFEWADLRVAGVLQRIAVVFFFCALLFLRTGWKIHAVLAALILVGYWIAMKTVPVPGIGIGVLEPGQNLAAYIDSFLLPGRMYQGNWDPEGVFSTLPAIGSGLTGMLIGRILTNDVFTDIQKVRWMILAGLAGVGIGMIWSLNFPLNKHIWTSSYVLVSSGLGSILLGISLWWIDIKKERNLIFPGVVFGMNAITAYVIHGIIIDLFISPWFGGLSIQAHWMNQLMGLGVGGNLASLAWALSYTSLCYVFIYWMYKRDIFLKV